MADGTGKAGGGPAPSTVHKGLTFTQKGNPDNVAPTKSPKLPGQDTIKIGG